MIKSWISQTAIFAVIAVGCALGTYAVVGPVDRSFPCDASSLKENEVCLSTVMQDWKGDVLWVDARGGEPPAQQVKGAIIISESHSDADFNKVAQRLFQAKVAGQKVVVFCISEACGKSKYVRGEIIKYALHDDIYILHGGWKALANTPELLE